MRPSGTEPKIKYYLYGKKLPAAGQKFGSDELTTVKQGVTESLKTLWAAIEKDIDARLAV